MRWFPFLLAGALLTGLVLSPGSALANGVDCARTEARIEKLEYLRDVFGKRVGRKLVGAADRYADHCVRLNQLQVLGTHNSYHLQPEPDLFALLLAFVPELFVWEYDHLPLAEQFSFQGIRQIELDVFHDPDGGYWADPRGLAIFEPEGRLPDMDDPGLKVFHVQEIDFRSTCPTLIVCLETIRDWSRAHRGHLPLAVMLELKDEAIPDPGFNFRLPFPFDADAMDGIDEEIRTVFKEKRLITPDRVRGGRATLEEAVLVDGWPTLGEARGKVIFLMDNGGSKRELYLEGHPSLAGRVLFTNAQPGDADAAFVKRNDPLGSFDEIGELVARGYLVRTRADADTIQARDGDTTQRDAALASGAQFVSTDYPEPNPDFGTGYFVEIPDGSPGRCNPVNAPGGCRNDALEALD